jgi:hypothetical protein
MMARAVDSNTVWHQAKNSMFLFLFLLCDCGDRQIKPQARRNDIKPAACGNS